MKKIEHLAFLAKIELKEDEKGKFEEEIESIIQYFNTLKGNYKDTEKYENKCPEKEDVRAKKKLNPHKLTQFFEYGFFVVPKVME